MTTPDWATAVPNYPVHTPPSQVGGGLQPPMTWQQLEATAKFFLESFIGQVAVALGGIEILGWRPLQFLSDWGQGLINDASNAYIAATAAQTTATAAATTQSQQTIAKPGYLATDATADAVFPIANISGATPSTISITSAGSIIGFIDTPDNGKKNSVIWLGQDITGLTAFYINVYQLDVTTGVATLIEASSNVLSSVSNTLAWNYYTLNSPITSQVGNVYAIEAVVVGSGTYKIAGLPSDWKPANTVASYPHQLGSARTSSLTPAPSTFTPSYSGTVPWFGLGGFEFAGPTTTPYSGNGVYTYSIPNWMKWGDCIDVIALPGGGGGQSAAAFIPGQGGTFGPWVTTTLIYGIDIPTSTTTLTVTVGAGGYGGGGGFGAVGGNGGDSTVAGTGLITVTATGGIGGGNVAGAPVTGTGPGNTTYSGVTYPGGNDVGAGASGWIPGGGGGGGGSYGAGGYGADGAVWLAAYQAGTTP